MYYVYQICITFYYKEIILNNFNCHKKAKK